MKSVLSCQLKGYSRNFSLVITNEQKIFQTILNFGGQLECLLKPPCTGVLKSLSEYIVEAYSEPCQMAKNC